MITSLQHAYSTHCTGQRSRLITAHGGHTEERTVVMGYLNIQPSWLGPVLCMALHATLVLPPMTTHTHTIFQFTHAFSIFQPYSTRDCNKIHRPLQIANNTNSYSQHSPTETLTLGTSCPIRSTLPIQCYT